MQAQRIDLNLFRVFDAIYQEGNLTRAAEVLHLTQPAVSNAQARLRAVYRDPLFIRNARGMSPTPLAENIAAEVRRALQLLNQCVDSNDTFDPATAARRFRIAAGDLTAAMVIPRLMNRLKGTGGNIEIEVQPLQRDQLLHVLAAGQADYALDAVPLGDQQIVSMKILEEDFVCAFRHDHPRLPDSLRLADYLKLEHAHPSSRHRGIGQIDLALKRLGKQRRVALHTHLHLGLPHVVASSDLVASIPKSIAIAHGLAMRRLPFKTPPSEVHAFWHKNMTADGASRWLRSLLSE